MSDVLTFSVLNIALGASAKLCTDLSDVSIKSVDISSHTVPGNISAGCILSLGFTCIYSPTAGSS